MPRSDANTETADQTRRLISFPVPLELHFGEGTISLRSKGFGEAFRTFDALFAFLAAGKLGRAQKSAWWGSAWRGGVRFHQCCARPNFCAAKKPKTPPTGGKPYGNACYAG